MKANFVIDYDNNHHLKHFFSKYAEFESKIKHDISLRLTVLISTQSYKIKFAGKLKHLGRRIEEYKIIVNPSLNCRVAFTVTGNNLKIIFISEIIRKNSYCKLLSQTNLVD